MKTCKINEHDQMGMTVKGHVRIEDDLGNVLLDKDNAIHPQNMARAIARGLAAESNYWIHRIAFGNGGTEVNAARQITYREPNDGISDGRGYQSELYNETYSEIVDENNINSELNTVTSIEIGTISQVITSVTLDPDQPASQPPSDNLSPTEATDGAFTFDEVALYTSGLPQSPTSGYQDVDVGNKEASNLAGLTPSGLYSFWVRIDSEDSIDDQEVKIAAVPSVGGTVTFQDVIDAINASSLGSVAVAEMSGDSSDSITYGKFRIRSLSTGETSTVFILDVGEKPLTPGYSHLFTNMQGYQGLDVAVPGSNAGVQDNVTSPTTEQERLLTHLIFSPINKTTRS
jgi:hypothetical protein